jgi:hypothetical protein
LNLVGQVAREQIVLDAAALLPFAAIEQLKECARREGLQESSVGKAGMPSTQSTPVTFPA